MMARVRGVSLARDVRDVEQEGRGVAIDEHRRGARARDGERARDEGVGRHHDLVARPDPERAQRELERIGAVRDADAVRHPDEAGEARLELRHLGAEDEAGALEHAGEPGAHLVGDLSVLGCEIDQRNPVRRQTGSSRPWLWIERVIASSVLHHADPRRPIR